MNSQNQKLDNNTGQQVQAQIHNKSKLSLVGLILAILIPPVGLIISIFAFYQIRNNRLQGKDTATLGVLLGSIFTLILLLFIISGGLSGLRSNEAKKDVQPFVSQIQMSGGKKICDTGDNGHDIDNTQPWYEAYYELPNSPSLTSEIKQYAAQAGYPLKKDTYSINQLKSNNTYGVGTATFNPYSDYLVSNKNGSSLGVTINRKTSVMLPCEGTKNNKMPTGDKAIIEIYLLLPRY